MSYNTLGCRFAFSVEKCMINGKKCLFDTKSLFFLYFNFWDLLQFCMLFPTKGTRKLLSTVTSGIGEKQLGLVSLFLRPLIFHILTKYQKSFVHELKKSKINFDFFTIFVHMFVRSVVPRRTPEN